MRFLQILDEQTKLFQLFRDADIPLAIIKGCAAAMYYPAPLDRSMGDIDFVVPLERIDEANRSVDDRFCDDVHRDLMLRGKRLLL